MTQLIPIPDGVAEYARLKALLQTALPDWTGLDSDPLAYLVDLLVAEQIRQKRLLNSSGQAVLLATAQGDDLDELVALVDLTRNAGESDADLRARVRQQFLLVSRDTASYVEVIAGQVDGVADARLDRESATGRNATVYIQATGYTASDSTLRTAVQTHLNDEDTGKPWFAIFAVNAETRYAYTLTGQGQDAGIYYTAGSDLPALRSAVEAALDARMLAMQRLGRTIRAADLASTATAIDGVTGATFALSGEATTQSWRPAGATQNTQNTAQTLYARDRVVYVGSRGTISYNQDI